MRRIWIAVAVALIAALPSPAWARSLADEIRATARGPVLLVLNSHGELVARTLEGSRARTLATGIAGSDVAYDPARELIWFRAADQLWVLDLRGSAPAVPIVEHMQSPGFVIEGADGQISIPGGGAALVLHWNRAPTLGDTGPRADLVDEPDDAARAIAAARLVGKAWLERNRNRARRGLTTRPLAGAPRLPDTQIPGGLRGADCDRSLCHRQIALGKTGLALLVTVDYHDHDGNHVACSLTEPASHRLVDPRRDCHGELEGSRTVFATRGERVLWDASGSHELDAEVVGFLDPGVIVEP